MDALQNASMFIYLASHYSPTPYTTFGTRIPSSVNFQCHCCRYRIHYSSGTFKQTLYYGIVTVYLINPHRKKLVLYLINPHRKKLVCYRIDLVDFRNKIFLYPYASIRNFTNCGSPKFTVPASWQLRVAIRFISSSVSVKSKISRFCRIRSTCSCIVAV